MNPPTPNIQPQAQKLGDGKGLRPGRVGDREGAGVNAWMWEVGIPSVILSFRSFPEAPGLRIQGSEVLSPWPPRPSHGGGKVQPQWEGLCGLREGRVRRAEWSHDGGPGSYLCRRKEMSVGRWSSAES